MSTPAAAVPVPAHTAPTDASPDDTATRTCPQCAAPLHPDPRFALWCPGCEWNLIPEGPGCSPTKHQQAAAARADRLFQELAAGRPTTTARRDWLAAGAIAGLVHLATLALFGWGLWLLATGNTPLRCLGAVALAAVVLLRPRLGRVPNDETVLARSAAPALYGLADRVAAEVGSPPVHVIRLTEEFNASFALVGLRRRPVLTIGLPLWQALDDPQRIALLGHEFGHRVNGDHRRGLWLSSAIGALAHWYGMARPRGGWGEGGMRLLFQLAELLSNAVMNTIAWVLWQLLLLLDRLTARAGQEAEYRADALAAHAGSTEAARGMLESLLLEGAANTVITRLRADHQNRRPRVVRRGTGHTDDQATTTPDALWDRLREHLTGLPPTERERLRRRSTHARFAVDTTHPPTHLRIALLDKAPALPAAVTITTAESTAIATELAPHRTRIARMLLAG
ncbi:M48 family metallopeptidase [Streptomyces sp. SP17BM10]|uniref:M48 family metallopeptidase n=1 Tax=Streptomyces sp. SP17BM10 TaxID=3002530 RepID=UPI002E76CBD1|nr:M48 family metallopeptidase [Streptomyces sp. SP17BM10]MEE1782786.1 M48 family metallopeptidase [Streptomyces sp. SP17BM10]